MYTCNIYICIYKYVNIYAYIRIHIRMYSLPKCLPEFLYSAIRICVHARIYIYIYRFSLYKYIYMYIYIYVFSLFPNQL